MSRVLDIGGGDGTASGPLDPVLLCDQSWTQTVLTFLDSDELMWSVMFLWYLTWLLLLAKERYDQNAEAMLENSHDWS